MADSNNMKKILQADKDAHPMPKAFEERLKKEMAEKIQSLARK